MKDDYLEAPFLDRSVFEFLWSAPDPEAPWLFKPLVRRPLPPLPRLSLRDRAALDEWSSRGFTEVERDVWLAVGIGRYNAAQAEQCVRQGITPSMLHEVEVDGRRLVDWLRGGETVGSIKARLSAAETA